MAPRLNNGLLDMRRPSGCRLIAAAPGVNVRLGACNELKKLDL